MGEFNFRWLWHQCMRHQNLVEAPDMKATEAGTTVHGFMKIHSTLVLDAYFAWNQTHTVLDRLKA